MSLIGRALHFVFKVGDRPATIDFYKTILGMKALRHEEFLDGCEAQCNGPYGNRWCKTMIGYGPEDTHFVVELTYNYGISEYERGNDFLGLYIQSSEAVKRAKERGIIEEEKDGQVLVRAPGGYPFYLIDKPAPVDKDPVVQVSLSSNNLTMTIIFWETQLGMKIIEQDLEKHSVKFQYDVNQAVVEFTQITEPIDHKKAYGRIAFSVPTNQLEGLQDKIKKGDWTILTPLVTLPTPGKADVVVVILADPSGHEICFVGDEGFRELSQVDPQADDKLDKSLKREQKQ